MAITGSQHDLNPTKNGNNVLRRWWQIFVKNRWAYLFISPFFILFIVFFLFPTIQSFRLSLFKWESFGDYSFVGLQNYVRLAKDALFKQTLWNSVALMVITTVPQIAISILLAVLINSHGIRGKRIWRTIYFLPITLSPVIVAVIFTLVFDENFGLLNYVLSLLNVPAVPWLTSTEWSKFSVSILVNWRWIGWNMVILLAALQGISQDLLDAAVVDGASNTQTFWHITLPLIKPTVVYLAMLGIIDGLRIFTEPTVLTRGGPAKSSMTVMMYMFNQAFSYFNYGYASSIAVVAFILIVVISTVSWKIIGKTNV
jgi:ABC-type sugar transport system permease subunit